MADDTHPRVRLRDHGGTEGSLCGARYEVQIIPALNSIWRSVFATDDLHKAKIIQSAFNRVGYKLRPCETNEG